ncbi:hypothetical protein cypCar_00010189 [Cyprinus carpio]|nr:hypothetical protein cypCar_00010189 [Cyprinus carpio]
MANSLKANVTLKAEKDIREEKEGAKEMDDTLDEPAEDEEERKARAAAEEAAARERAAQRQLMVIEELVQTERNYLKHLQLCTVTIHSNLQKIQPPPPNLENMFQHIDEVMDVSSRLLSLLDQTQIHHSEPKYLETLCDSFLSLSQDIEMAYKEYLANYNNITALENSYKQKEALWVEMVRIVKSSAPDVNASTLSFFLVMPVQRIARYPLLLQTIQKHTDPGHPAYPILEHAAHTAVQINCRINEYKRFREVADKYRKTENLTIKDKINRLSGHSIAKKTARFSQYIKHETGMVPKRFLSCRPEEADLDLEGDKTALFSKEITVALRQWIYPSYEERLKTLVFKPLSSLRELMAGPRNLICKRQDKLLDYELIEEKSNLSFEEQAIANTYKTINTLLLTELPQFNGKALQLLWATLEAFSCLQRDLAADIEQLATSFTHQALNPMCERRLKALTAKHGSEKIYQLTGPVVGTRDLDLTLNKGELVAVVSEMDTRGDCRRWLVDAGGPRGYVPALKLARYHQITIDPPQSPHLKVTPTAPGPRRHSYTPGAQPLPTTITTPCFQVYAGYDFTARSAHELSLRAGEQVRVVEPHDKRGNKDWSLVEARGQRGYVPSNYLTILPSVIASPTFPYR